MNKAEFWKMRHWESSGEQSVGDTDGIEVHIYLIHIARRHALLLILDDFWHLVPDTAFSFLGFGLSSIIALVALDRSLRY